LKILFINTGGTFNKIYNKINGKLVVPKSDEVLKKVLNSTGGNFETEIVGTIYKDSLEMTDEDREKIFDILLDTDAKNVIIIHGTDTMRETAEFLSERIFGKRIVLVGAMKPILFDSIDGSLNLGVALGFLQSEPFDGTYISMSGLVSPFDKIEKDKKHGVFRTIAK
jgi:L-asparaginase